MNDSIAPPIPRGSPSTIRTGQRALKWLIEESDSSGKLARWRLRFSELDFSIVYRSGIKHQEVDALSRLPTNRTDKTPLDDIVSVLVLANEIFAQERKQSKQDADENVMKKQVVDTSIRFLMEEVVLTDQVLESGIDIFNLTELTQHQSRDNKYRQATITVGKLNTKFGYSVDEVLVRMLPIDSV